MTALLRAASPALAAILGPNAPAVQVWSADLFTLHPDRWRGGDGSNWTGWDRDLACRGVAYRSQNPWVERISVVRFAGQHDGGAGDADASMLRSLDGAFAGGAQIKQQIAQGLPFDSALDAAQPRLHDLARRSRRPGRRRPLRRRGGRRRADRDDGDAVREVEGQHPGPERAAQPLPGRLQPRLLPDPGCTLDRASLRPRAYVGAGANPPASFIPWAGSPPASAALYQNGTFTLTGGAGAGRSKRTDCDGERRQA